VTGTACNKAYASNSLRFFFQDVRGAQANWSDFHKNRLIKEKLKVLVAAAAAIEAAMSCQRQQVVHVHRTLHCAYQAVFFY